MDMAAVSFKALMTVLVICGCTSVYSQQDCRTETFQVQPNFNESMFQGKWYEVKWILEPWIPIEWNFFDLAQNFTKTNYGYSLSWEGRWPANATHCSTSIFTKLFSTGNNAKYIRQAKRSPTVVYNSTYWIVDTDYDNFALVYGCREEAVNGTCVDPAGYMWTRCPNPTPEYVERMEKRLPALCLTPQQFIDTYHKRGCSGTPSGCKSSGNNTGVNLGPTGLTSLLAAIILVLVI